MKKGAKVMNDPAMLERIQKYEEMRYGKHKLINDIVLQAKINSSVDRKHIKKVKVP